MTVRLATPADAAALAEVAAATFALACPPTTTADAIARHIETVLSAAAFQQQLDDPARVLLVEDGGPEEPLAGYTVLVLQEPADPDVLRAVRIHPTSELSKCYVREGRHGRGTASALMTRSLEIARERGAAGMWLGTNVANARALRFYEKHGFERVGHKRFRLGGVLEDDFVLERALWRDPGARGTQAPGWAHEHR